ncbi:penicillin-binding protein 1C [Tropicimonas sp. IMCC34011]|uniref:penicillin-binding protein 1C n=1 Tax=Tropicimonas sp. IMCC34011 TaxID=2248759 RepID=UPI000E2272C2
MRKAALGLAGLALVLGLGAGLRDGLDRWVDRTVLPPLTAELSREVLDREGRLMRAYTVADGRWRLGAGAPDVDPLYIAMLTAYEDRRFRDHPGIDARAMLRAALSAVKAGHVVSGGSTLTMQAARLLEESGTGRWAGKIRQARVALALERRMSKDEVLRLYLDRAPFGGNLEGVRAATLAWFGKEPRRLTPAEAALLVALPQSPEARRPDRDPAAARAARDRVLLHAVRAGVLNAEAAEAAMRSPVPTRRRAFPAHAPHLADRLRGEDPSAQTIRTSLDLDLQTRLETLATRAARDGGDRLSAAILVADHRTGEVLASVGSAGYLSVRRGGAVDMTRAVRSPGSTLKPLIYGLAFARGLAHPETLIEDRPTTFAGGYAPTNFDGAWRGTIRVRQALQLSLNIPAVALTEAVGPARLLAHLRRAGASPRLPGGEPGLAVALGGVGLSLEDLVRLYGALGRGGREMPLSYGTAVPSQGREVLPEGAAWQVGHILSGIAPPPAAPRIRLAYKTGTSYGHRDAWAIGYDGRHVIGVWLGRPDGTPVPGAFGGDLAAPILFEAFGRLKPRTDPLPQPPSSVLLGPDLPAPLRRFGAEGGPEADAPQLSFPRDGTEIEAEGLLVLKVRDGTPPFTWLAGGAPVATGEHRRETVIDAPGPGFLSLSVIDAEGRAARAEVFLR